MAGPWERYRQESKPWERYRQTGQAAPSPQVTQRRGEISRSRAEYEAQLRDVEARKAKALAELEGRVGPRKGGFFGNLSQYQGVAGPFEQQARTIQEQLKALSGQEQFMERTGRAPKRLTTGEKVAETLKAIPRGAIEGVSQAAGLAGALGPTGERIAKGAEEFGTDVNKFLGLEQTEDVKEALQFDPMARQASQLGGGFGSVLPYVVASGPSLLARGASLLMGTGQGATQARKQIEEFEQKSGQQVDPTTRQLVQLGGGAIGLTELIPIPGLVARLPENARRTATARLTDIATKVGLGKLAPEAAQAAVRRTVQDMESMAAGRILMRGAEEGGQEAGAQFAQNVLERLAYNEDKDVTEGLAENAALGAVVGGGIRGGAEIFQRVVPAGEQLTEEEQALRGREPLESVEIAIPSVDDPNIIGREKVDILSAPDKEGYVVVRRPNGKLSTIAVDTLDSMRVSEESDFQPSDAFSGEMISGRLEAAAGEKPTKQTSGFTAALNLKLSNALALGRTQDAANYISALEKRFSGVRKKQASLQAAKGGISAIEDPTLRVLFEAKSILNDYRAEYAKQRAQPGVTVGEPTPPPTGTLAQILEKNRAAQEEDMAARKELLKEIATDRKIVDKHNAFAEALADRGLRETTDNEASALLDIMRMESAYETADIKAEESVARQAALRRAEIIEDALSDPEIDLPNRIRKVNADLMRAGFNPTSPEEVSRIRGRSFAENVFGPSGEYQRRLDAEAEQRQTVLDSVMSDPTITDKYRGFIELADELGLAPPSAEELEMMRDAVVEEPTASQVSPVEEVTAEDVAPEAAPEQAASEELPTEVAAAPEEEVPVTKVAPGTARGAEKVERGTQGVVKGRPVEGAAELTAGMQEEQELNKRLNIMRNNNLITDQDIGEVLNLVRVPQSQADLDALPASQRERWLRAIELTRDMEAKAEQRDQTENKKEKKQLEAAIKATNAELDMLRGAIAKGAMREASFRVAKRKDQRKQIDDAYKAGEITKSERDIRIKEMRIETPLAPRMAAGDIVGARTEAAARFLGVAKRTRSAHEVLRAVIAEGGPLGEVAQRLLDIAPDVRVLVVDPETARMVARNTEQRLDEVPEVEGVWAPARKAIYLSSGMTVDHTPIHEIAHAILSAHIEQGTTEGRQIAEIYEMFKALASPEQRAAYGFKDAHEFASEVWGNEAFRQLIRELTPQPTKADPKPRNLLQRMLDVLTNIFRKEARTEQDTAPIIDYVEQVMQATEQAAGKSLQGKQTRAIETQLRENPNNPRAGQVGIMARIQQMLKPLTKMQSAIARKLNYSYQDIVDYDKQLADLYGVDQLPENMSVANKAELMNASRSGRQLQLDRTHIQPMLKKIADLGLDLQDVGMYLWARSAKDRNALVRSRNAAFPEGGSGMKDSEAQAIIKDYALRGLEPQLREVAKMHDRLVDYMLNVRVQEGLLTREQANTARKLQPFYTPLKGYAADGDMQTMGDDNPHSEGEYQRNLGIRRTEYTKSAGRKSMPYNPMMMLISDAKQLIQRASINKVGQQLLDNLISDPEANADVATFYTDTDSKIRVKPSENVEYPDGIPVHTNMRMERGKYLVVKRKGTPYYIEFADTDAGRALKRAFDNMTPEQLKGFMKAWVVTSNAMKSLMTRFSPPYLPRALVRDVMDAVANAYAAETDKSSPAFGKKLGAKVAAYTSATSKTGRMINGAIGRHLMGLEPKTEEQAEMMLLLDQMIEDGGSPGHAVIHDLELLTADAEKQLEQLKALKEKDPTAFAKAVPGAILSTLDATSQAIDLKARLATYVAALEEGISREGAARLALNSSLNLTRRGEWARYLDSTFFFWSPAVESARRFKNMALSSSNGRKIIMGQMAMGAMLALWNAWMGAGDDDEDGRPNYMDLPDTTKQTSLVIMTGPGVDDYVAIPLGFMLSFPTYVGQKLTEAAQGEISDNAASISIADAAKSIAAAAITTFSPVRPQGAEASQLTTSLVPNLAKPFADLMWNRNYFDTPIYVKSFSEDRSASSLGREDTGRVWKWMARSMNDMTGGVGTVGGGADVQPEALRYLFEAYAGGLYRTAEDTATFITEDNKGDKTLAQRLPIVRSYVGKGGEYVPMKNYFENTEEQYAAPLVVSQPKMDQLVRQQKYEPDLFEEKTRKKYPLRTDERIMEAYKEANSTLDRLGRERREALLGESDPEVRRSIIEDFRAQQADVYKQYNQAFNAVKAEYK